MEGDGIYIGDPPTIQQQQQQQLQQHGGRRNSTTIVGMEALEEYDKTTNAADENLTEAEKQMRDEELSFYSNSEHDYGDDNIWGLLSGVGGNIYEWYVPVLPTFRFRSSLMRLMCCTQLRKCPRFNIFLM